MLPPYTTDRDLASIKLIATDMDLTLLHDDKTMPAGMPERIANLDEHDILFCAASGRPAPALRESFPSNYHRMALIADNGGSVYLGDGLIYKSLIDTNLYQELLRRVIGTGRGVPVLCAFDEAYVRACDHIHHDELSIYYKTINYVDDLAAIETESNKVSILCPEWDSKELFDTIYQPEFGDRLYVTCAGGEWLDFMNIGVDKGAGIRHLAEHLGIDLADVAAFGDTFNDIPMLQAVGHSFLVANAAEHMQEHARYTCPSNNDEGVATVIDAILAAKQA